VEVKARRGKDHAWAARLHRNMRADLGNWNGFFLLITPQHTYLWRGHASADGSEPEADAVIDTSDLLPQDVSGEALSDGQALELLVSAWLSSLLATDSVGDVPEPAHRFLQETGLFDALRGGALEFEAA
jgi:hypothetical protein